MRDKGREYMGRRVVEAANAILSAVAEIEDDEESTEEESRVGLEEFAVVRLFPPSREPRAGLAHAAPVPGFDALRGSVGGVLPLL